MSETLATTSGVSGRYSAALFYLGEEQNCLDSYEKDISVLQDMLRTNADFENLIFSPLYSRADQERAVVRLAEGLNVSKDIMSLLALMARKRRLNILPNVIKDFQLLMQESRGEILVEVTSESNLSKSQKIDLEKWLESSVNKKVSLDTRIDKTIIGGLIVKIGSKMIDTTIKSKLIKMQKMMKEVS